MKNKEYKKFKFIFHIFLFFAGIGLITLSIAAWSELDRAPLYLILGIALIVECITSVYKHFKRRSSK